MKEIFLPFVQGRKNATLLELLICLNVKGEFRTLLKSNMPVLRMDPVSLQKLIYLIILVLCLTQQVLTRSWFSRCTNVGSAVLGQRKYLVFTNLEECSDSLVVNYAPLDLFLLLLCVNKIPFSPYS